MSDKKHIDRLFQERFKDFEAAPSDAVWDNIEAQLNPKKKKHRIIPIWWRYAGIAALLLLLLTVGSIYFNNQEEAPVNNVVDTKDIIKPESEKNKILDDSNKTEPTITANNAKDNLEQEPQTGKASGEISHSKETFITETTASKNKNLTNPSLNNLNKKSTTTNPFIKTENKAVLAAHSKEENSNNNLSNKTITNSNINNSNETLKKEDVLIEKEKAKKIISNTSKNNTGIAKNNDGFVEINTNSNTKENTRSIDDAIDKNKKIIEEEEKSNRWSIAPNAAPVYFNSLSEGSSIDPQFNSNSKSTELNMSYGIKASYAINKKLSVRSGINKVNLGYNTNNVVMFQSLGAKSSAISALKNVNSNRSTAANLSLISGASLVSSEAPESFSKTSNSSINQSLGYIEVPLEMQYALSNKKFGVNVIGGFSSFFLSNNKIFSETEGSKTFIGEANNINNVSYSANFGLGLNYKFSKKIDLNLEPMFKYQINTFNNTSGDFKPYFIGVYTGFAIKF